MTNGWTIREDENGTWKTKTNENGIKEELLVTPSQKWIDENSKVNLYEKKALKIFQLSNDCEKAIEAGFTSKNGHIYRTNQDDQLNFIGKYNQLMSDTTINEVFWKTEDAGYIIHTREDWLSVYSEGITHKEQTLFKLDSFRQRVNAATTIEEVEAVIWK